MGAIAHKEPSKAYQEIRAVGDTMNERQDCTVIALALLCSTSYKRAHKALATAGRRSRCGCKTPVIKAAIEALGYTVREWSKAEHEEMMDSYGLPASKRVRTITTHHPRQTSQGEGVAEAWEGTHPNMLFITAKHCAAYKDNVVQDWALNRALYVKEIWEVNKK
jgi:hypothetical protein